MHVVWMCQVLVWNISVCVDLCVYICAFAHICMSGGNLVLNVLRFWVELYLDDASLLHDFDDKSLNWFVPLLSKVKKK